MKIIFVILKIINLILEDFIMKNQKFKFVVIIFLILFSIQILSASEKEKICPFELISFTAETIRDSVNNNLIVNLEWKTASEMNTDKFIIEKDSLPIPTFPELEFNPIGERKAAGNSSTTRTYNFSDTSELGIGNFLYRIKGIDKDGSFSYSEEIFIDNLTGVIEYNTSQNLINRVYPNPSFGTFNISLNNNNLGYINISILTLNGEILKSFWLESSKELKDIDLNGLSAGEYYLNVSRATYFEIRKIVIIK